MKKKEQEKQRLCAILNALSDPVRISIVEQLAVNDEMSVGDLSQPFSITAPAISRHLRVLESAGVIVRRVDRQWRLCSLNKGTLDKVSGWVSQHS